jgi:hypothetical protein
MYSVLSERFSKGGVVVVVLNILNEGAGSCLTNALVFRGAMYVCVSCVLRVNPRLEGVKILARLIRVWFKITTYEGGKLWRCLCRG